MFLLLLLLFLNLIILFLNEIIIIIIILIKAESVKEVIQRPQGGDDDKAVHRQYVKTFSDYDPGLLLFN